MSKLLACMIFLTISLFSQNALATAAHIEGGSTATCVGQAGISGVETPLTITTQIGDCAINNIVKPDLTYETSAAAVDKDFNVNGFAQVVYSGSPLTVSTALSSTYYNQYALTGHKWATNTPLLKYSYFYSGQPTNLQVMNVVGDLNQAEYIWNSQTNRKLFASAGITGIYNVPFSVSPNDGIHEIGWANLGVNGYLAINTIAFNIKTGYMVDADVALNRQLKGGWTTSYTNSWITCDVETIALHELGHSIGLADIYNNPYKMWDTTEIMNSYAGSHRYLGQGDISGIHAMYRY